MGFPVGYTEVFLPRLLVHTLSFLGFVRSLIICLFDYLGLSDFVEMDNLWSENPTLMQSRPSVTAALIRDFLPVIKFEDLAAGAGEGIGELPESCAVCLYEFEGEAEIRWLKNCKHIFHRACLDRWMDQDRNTCPLCRTSFVPDCMQEEFNQRLWAASDYSDVGDFYTIGVVCRNSNGQIVTGQNKLCYALSPATAEAIALRLGMQLALSLGGSNVIIETDCRDIVSKLKADPKTWQWSVAPILWDICRLLESMNNCFCNAISRLANKVADWVANQSLSGLCPVDWISNPPSNLQLLLFADLLH